MLVKSLRPSARPQTLLNRIAQEAKMPKTEVEKHATTQVPMNTRSPMLLGIFGKEGAPHALVRMPSGKVSEIKPGDRLSGATVAAIDAESVILARNGNTQRLTMP